MDPLTPPPRPPLEGLRAVVVDEWALFREGVASVLAAMGVEVVGQAGNIADALLRLWSGKPELMVAGSPAHARVSELVVAAKRAHPHLRVLALLPVSEAGELRPVLSSGADAVLTRTVESFELEDAVRKLAAGERVLAPAALSVLMGLAGASSPGAPPGPQAERTPHGLTAKELEVLSLLAKEMKNREMAEALVVSQATVKSHLANINRKLGVTDRREAVRRAFGLGILR